MYSSYIVKLKYLMCIILLMRPDSHIGKGRGDCILLNNQTYKNYITTIQQLYNACLL